MTVVVLTVVVVFWLDVSGGDRDFGDGGGGGGCDEMWWKWWW